jgi:hypothetical protein
MNDFVRTSVGRLVMVIGLATAALAFPSAAAAQVANPKGPLTNGANHAGTIASLQTDAWTVAANAGDAIVLHLAEVGADSPFTPWVGLFSPAGTLVGSSNDGSLAGHINVNAVTTGTYTVYVRSGTSETQQNSGAGSYLLTLAKVPGTFIVPEGDEGGPMVNGASHPGYIHRGDQDQWTFVATAGESASISIGEVGGDTTFAPWIRLFGPNGAYLLEGYSQLGGKIDYTLPLTGTYTVVVADSYVTYAATGSYLLTLAKAGAPFVVPTNDDGGPLSSNTVYQAQITRADLDQWAFRANAGQAVTVTAAEVLGNTSFAPWLRVYGPTGSFIGEGFGPTGATVNLTAQLTGQYTVVVASSDSGGANAYTGAGYYSITATGITTPPAIALGDIALNFGPSSGLWVRSNHAGNGQWTQIHAGSPAQMARGDIDGTGFVSVIATFPGNGVWIWRQTGWSKLHPLDASRIISADLDGNGQEDVVLDFPGYGVWVRYNNTTWQQLHALDVTTFAAGNINGDANRRSDLIATFPGYGVYAWVDNSFWQQLHALDGFDIRTGDFDGNGVDDILMNFAGQGIWIRSNNSSWAQFHRSNSAGVAVGDLDGNNAKDLVINFPGDGVWKYVGTTWTKINQSNAPVMSVIDLDKNGRDDVVLDFTGYGVWLYFNNTGYDQLHPADVTAIASGRFDIN